MDGKEYECEYGGEYDGSRSDMRDVSGFTDCADEDEDEDEDEDKSSETGAPLRWQGQIGNPDVVVPPRVAGYVAVAQEVLKIMLSRSKKEDTGAIGMRASRAGGLASTSPSVTVL